MGINAGEQHQLHPVIEQFSPVFSGGVRNVGREGVI